MRGLPPVPDAHHDLPRHRLKALEERLAAKRQPEVESNHMASGYAQANLAWRMVIELLAGLLIGFGIGYGLDSLFGTIPVFLVIFTLLGMAAGIKTMLASAKEVEMQQAAQAAKNEDD